MKKTLILLILILNFISCNNNSSIEKKIDAIFNEFQNDNTPGTSIAIVEKGKIIYQKGFGLADLEKKVGIEPKTNFRLASITKQFTAL